MNTPKNLQLAFDVGHSSIGWAVLENQKDHDPELLGCGSVIFQADDCLASQRRGFRRQRRHIRSTRQRISRIKKLLAHLGVLSAEQLDAVSSSSPWLLAARALANGELLTWPQLWDVIRWVAHNRGYDGNKRWSGTEDTEAEKEDTEKVNNARALFEKYGTQTMAETFCRVLGLDPLTAKSASQVRFKGLNAAFPREDVEREVRTILKKHIGKLPKVNADLIFALMEDWRAISCESLSLPLRYEGGLLFGQLVPRFENRIIATCPITFERVYQDLIAEGKDEKVANHEAQKLAKVPNRDCPEFLQFRWAMQLANIQIVKAGGGTMRFIENADWRKSLNDRMNERGHLTPTEVKKAVRELTGTKQDNLQQMFMHPDAKEALLVDPVQQLITSGEVAPLFQLLPERLQKRLRGQWRRGKKITIREIREQLSVLANDEAVAAFDAEIQRQLDGSNTRKNRKSEPLTREGILKKPLTTKPQSGRAAYHRDVLKSAYDDVMLRGIHPKEEGGALFRNEAIRNAQLQRKIDEQTNNHLVRHRLKILERLHRDIIKEFANDDLNLVERVTIEVNRDLREMSGKTAKQVAQDLGQRLANFKCVSGELEKNLESQNIPITAGLIRKARIAEDLGWHCPYTGKSFDAFDLLHRKVDKDHIVPRSLRPSDSLDSQVITFAEVNKWKSKRTAVQFIEQEGGKSVPGRDDLTIKTITQFLKDVDALEAFKGHEDDKRRKRNRKRLLQIRDYVEKEFTPGDLTQTSQLVRLGAQALERAYMNRKKPLTVISLPGSVTGTVRKGWNLLGCLSVANPQVLDENESVRSKTEIRGITHLHHALDACVIAFTSHFIPNNGGIWELLIKRKLNVEEQNRLRRGLGNSVQITQDGAPRLNDLSKKYHQQISKRLAERRVVQHIPKEMTGLRVEQNPWRVVEVANGEALLRQRVRQTDGQRPKKEKREKINKLLGLHPNGDKFANGEIGKLQRNQSVLIIPDNYGLALDPEPTIIPFHKVWPRLRELQEKNGGKMLRVLRNGMLIRVPKGRYVGIWRIFSAKATLTLDMAVPDKVSLESKGVGQKREVSLKSLLKDDMTIIQTSLTGVVYKMK